MLDRKLLGPRWSRKPEEDRPHFVAVPESDADVSRISMANLHYHSMTCLGPHKALQLNPVDLKDLVGALWYTCFPRGDIDVHGVFGAAGASSYAIKCLAGPAAIGLRGICIR